MKKLFIVLVIVIILIGIGIGYKMFSVPKEYFDGEEITWAEAKELVSECRSGEVWQTHARQVTVILDGNIRLKTIEPKLDDIIDVAESAQEKCGKIIIGTE